MARHDDSDRRIEPSFDGGLNASQSDRVGGPSRGSRDSSGGGSRRGGSRRDAKASAKRSRKRSGGFFGLIRSMIYWGIVLAIWGMMGIGGIFLYYGAKMPNATTWSIPERPPNIKIVAADGSVIANRGSTGGEALSLDSMSPYLPEAVISIEDRRFYYHFGFDPIGLARAVVTNLISGHTVQGGSTLTQQLAKNLFLTPERTMERKVQEVLLAIWLEHKFTKDEILAMYLNRVYFGANAYGVEAAARRYYNKSARDLNLMEAATIAGLLKAPSRLSPARDPAAAKARAEVVLGAMKDAGYINEKQVQSALSQAPDPGRPYMSSAGQYVADMVMDRLHDMVGDVKEDLIVDTTIDPTLETEAGDAIRNAINKEGKRLNVSQGALVAIDGTGAIRALVGGKDYAESQYDRAYKALRQPGSAFKPFVYAAALEQGATPDSIRNDAPVRIGDWTPENYEKKYNGPVTLSYALAHSLNTIAAQLVMEAGPQQVIKVAHRMGIEADLQPNASIALGTSEVTLMDLTASYAPFMNGGYKATPHVVRRITTASGKVLYENTYDDPPRVLEPNIVAMMNGMMTRVVTEGTGRAARLSGWQVAGKTGTTQSSRDALFVGFTSDMTTGIWFGNDDGTPMKRVTGGGLPAQTWHQFMVQAEKGKTPAPIFGTSGGPIAPAQPPKSTVPMASRDVPEKSRTLTDIISDFLNGKPAQTARSVPPPTQVQPAVQPPPAAQPGPVPPAAIDRPQQNVRSRSDGSVLEGPVPPGDIPGGTLEGPVPPGDVGAQNTRPQGTRQKTLLDIINGN
ncbi:MAG TPA: transglycosylase domain-containing protein [Ensifer sp.]|nr:transglycosylase domain-containing protein [Ensifer sp.]